MSERLAQLPLLGAEAGLFFTLKVDDAGNWKIIKAHQISKKELEEEK